MKTSEVYIRAIHNVDRSRLWGQQVEDVDVVEFAVLEFWHPNSCDQIRLKSLGIPPAIRFK